MNYSSLGYQLNKGIFIDEVLNLKKKISYVFRFYTNNYKSEFDELLIDLFHKDFDGFVGCANVCQNLPDLYNLCFHHKMISLLNNIGLNDVCLNTRPLISFSSKFTAKNEFYWRVPPHQDWPSTLGSLNGVTCWVPLVDLHDSDLGPLEISPQSHLFGLKKSCDAIMSDAVDCNYDKILMSIGDILFFNNFTIHKSGNNITKKIRISVHFRYDDFSETTFVERKFPRNRKDVREKYENTNNFPSIDQIKKSLKI